jgi:hypothetical protein
MDPRPDLLPIDGDREDCGKGGMFFVNFAIKEEKS